MTPDSGWIASSPRLPLLPPALLQKYIRLKRIKVNGKRAEPDTRLSAGDLIELYINDEFFPVASPLPRLPSRRAGSRL